ncbi:MAG: DNA polymerase I [Anaerolineales bacterium]|nr:DNA polymerase I [Anaerolineales bacterium]
MPPTIYLLDGHALAYRAYFALSAAGSQRWQTPSGEPTAGVYGFASTLLRILEQEKPDYIAVAFDTGKTFRDEIFPEYKATREKMPEDLRPQIERIRILVDTFNIPRIEMQGYEADDVLGSLARIAVENGLGVKIITGDRDLLQLVNERVIVNLPGKSMSDAKDYITAEQVREYFGVRPDQVVDYKALVGDNSDNIPGVPGVGEKTAQKLLDTYETLDEVYAHLAEIEARWSKKLEEGKDLAYMSRDLAQIHTDLPVELDLEQARVERYDPSVVQALFRELQFNSLIGRLEKLTRVVTPVSGQQMTLFDSPTVLSEPRPSLLIDVWVVDTPDALEELVAKLQAAEVIAFDTETTSTDEIQAQLVGISLAVNAGTGYYIPVGHSSGRNLPVDQVISALKAPMSDANIRKVAHNIKYDYILLERYGLRVAPLSFDTMLAEFLINPASRTLGLKNLAMARLGEEMTKIETLVGSGKSQTSMAEVNIETAAAYAAADAEVCLRLMPLLLDDLKRVEGQKLLDEIEMPLVEVLAGMEMNGILLDLPFLEEMSQELQTRLEEIEKQVYDLVGKVFNLNSTQQLSEVLFSRLGLSPPDRTRKTTSGHYSTSADVLEAMRGQHSVVDLILEHRELAKLKSTYVDALPDAINPGTGRVHTSYNQTGAVTGRIASSNPNLQNIPIRTELGRRVRNGFIAAPGNILLAVDYSQIELRIVAHMANDNAMLAAFRSGQDIHATTAAAIYDVALDKVTREQRRHAKAINFGLIYGMSPFGLTRTTDLTLSEAENFVAAYFRQFPGVKKYLDNTRKLAADQGYVATLLGRRRYFPALQTNMNRNLKNREEREAINAPVQGTAADIMKIAMLHIPVVLKKAGLHGRMLLQVHDEIVLECPQQELEPSVRLVQHAMETAYQLEIPLSTEARWGKRWGEMQVFK